MEGDEDEIVYEIVNGSFSWNAAEEKDTLSNIDFKVGNV